jgi:hypothetical protein
MMAMIRLAATAATTAILDPDWVAMGGLGLLWFVGIFSIDIQDSID